MSSIIAAAALSRLLVVHDCSNANIEPPTKVYAVQSGEVTSQGLRKFYAAGLGVALVCTGSHPTSQSFRYFDYLKGWHEGEEKIHTLLHVPYRTNPTSPFLTPRTAALLKKCPLLAVGTLDASGNPWATVWGGEAGFARSLGSSVIGVATSVDRFYDPVIEILVGGRLDGEIMREEGKGQIVSTLCIDLATRARAVLSGRVVFGALGIIDVGKNGEAPTGQVQLVIEVENSMAHCPKYLNQKQIIPSMPNPTLVSSTPILPPLALALLSKADLFFISTFQNATNTGTTNHRGGVPGFVRVISNSVPGTVLAFPEYSGNRFYQTLGNLHLNPKAGLIFPDFDSGDVLYVTGVTQTLIGKDASALLPHSNIVVKLYITAARFIEQGLPFRGKHGERSPYNPALRYLHTEKPSILRPPSQPMQARLLSRTLLTPTIARFRFRTNALDAVGQWKAGQDIALSFEDEIGGGYGHVRNNDPKTLNDDYVRTFTVSSALACERLGMGEFEIMIRNVGVVTAWLFRCNIRSELQIPLRGFGKSFITELAEGAGFVAGGIGITPLLGHLDSMPVKIPVFWSLRVRDVGLASATFELFPTLIPETSLFISGINGKALERDMDGLCRLENEGVKVIRRRMEREDVTGWSGKMQEEVENSNGLSEIPTQEHGKQVNPPKQAVPREEKEVRKWYICAGKAFRESIVKWVEGDAEAVWEDFGY